MLCWNVYVSNFNNREIEVYNIFKHAAFYDDCVKAKKKNKDDKNGFAEDVIRSLCYYFWSKCEWEIILGHWPSGEYSEMRKDLKYGKLIEAMRSIGVEYNTYRRPWNKDDTDITIRVYPNPERFRDKKIDVYEQVVNNWDIFINWLWENRKELKARK